MKNLPLDSQTAARPAHVPPGHAAARLHTAPRLHIAASTGSIPPSFSLRQPARALPRSLALGALVLSASLLTACGGGGADSQTGAAPSPVSGGTMIPANGDHGIRAFSQYLTGGFPTGLINAGSAGNRCGPAVRSNGAFNNANSGGSPALTWVVHHAHATHIAGGDCSPDTKRGHNFLRM